MAATTSRPLGNLEVFFKKLADLGAPLGREHWAVSLALDLRVPPPASGDGDGAHVEPHLRRAWQEVRRQHPAIGSVICPAGDGAAREVLAIPGFDAARWDRDTFLVHEAEADADSLFPLLGPTPTATCHWLPRSSQVVLRSSHWRLDGIGMARLGHVFLTNLAEVLCAGPEADCAGLVGGGPTAGSLPPSLEGVARVWRQKRGARHDDDAHAHAQRLEAGADALVGEFLRGVPSIGLPTRPGSDTARPGASARVEVRLGAARTAEVAGARRARGLSFTGAFHAAVVRVAARFPQHPLARSYAAFFPVDLRPSIVAAAGAAPEEQLTFGLYFSGLPVCVAGVVSGAGEGATEAKTFAEVAREMTAVYSRDLTAFWTAPDGEQVPLMELAEPYLQRTTALFNTPPPEGLPPVQTPDLSGLGRLEAYLRRDYQAAPGGLAPTVEVSDVWIATERIDRCVQFHVWSWRDEVRLGASFNQSFYEGPFVAGLLDQIVEELLRGLELWDVGGEPRAVVP